MCLHLLFALRGLKQRPLLSPWTSTPGAEAIFDWSKSPEKFIKATVYATSAEQIGFGVKAACFGRMVRQISDFRFEIDLFTFTHIHILASVCGHVMKPTEHVNKANIQSSYVRLR